VLEEKARVGNFVEVKNAVLDKGAKANHLTDLGDADVGAGANIGAGTITCNYDGYFKYRTVNRRARVYRFQLRADRAGEDRRRTPSWPRAARSAAMWPMASCGWCAASSW